MKPRDAANFPDTGNSSPVAVRHAYVLGPAPDEAPYAKGGDAAVYLSLVNQTTEADRLTSASSPVAEEVKVASTGGPQKGAGKDGNAKPAGGESSGIELPAPPAGTTEGDPVLVGQPPYSQNTITLTGLKQELRNGAIVTVELTFQRAGTITMKLPVVPRAAYRSTLSPAPSQSPSESASESASPNGTESGSPTETEEP